MKNKIFLFFVKKAKADNNNRNSNFNPQKEIYIYRKNVENFYKKVNNEWLIDLING